MQFLCATLNRYFCASRPQRLSLPLLHITTLTTAPLCAIIIIIDKTDAGLNGLFIRDITLICDVINMYNNYYYYRYFVRPSVRSSHVWTDISPCTILNSYRQRNNNIRQTILLPTSEEVHAHENYLSLPIPKQLLQYARVGIILVNVSLHSNSAYRPSVYHIHSGYKITEVQRIAYARA